MTNNRLRMACALGALSALGLMTLGQSSKAPRPPADSVRIHVLNVGQGDSTIIEGPRDDKGDRKILIVDAGESTKMGNEAQHVIEPALRNLTDDGKKGRAILDIDYLIPTHYHKDHMGSTIGKEPTGIFYLWEALNIRVKKILDTGLNYDGAGQGDRTYRNWVKENNPVREKLSFTQTGPDRQIDMGEDIWVEVQAVGAEVPGRGRVVKDKWISTTSQNDFSTAMVVHYKKFDFYVAGDLSGYLHESWGAWYHSIESATFPQLRPIEAYRVNHHGSQWSSNYAFMQRLRPLVSLISCGRGHHHPNEYTVQRLLGFEDYWTGRPIGSDIFQTKNDDGFLLEGPHPHTLKTQNVANGHILIESDGETSFSITMPGEEPIYFPLHDDPAFTDVPWSVKKAMEAQVSDGSEASDENKWEEVYDRQDAEDGKTVTPIKDKGMRGD
jgi:beta-lactamase superfamily II metal-dependent hydrolase